MPLFSVYSSEYNMESRKERPMDTFEHTSPSAHPLQPSTAALKLHRRGFAAGTVGAATIALWFLLLDLIHGHPLFTPTILGTAAFKGVMALATVEKIPVTFDVVIGFTFVHWLSFAALGCIASQIFVLAERNPQLDVGVIVLFVMVFVVFEFGFLAAATTFASPVLQALAWPTATILIGNLLAVVAMGFYLWRWYPHPAA